MAAEARPFSTLNKHILVVHAETAEKEQLCEPDWGHHGACTAYNEGYIGLSPIRI